MSFRPRGGVAFSLVELLVVVAVISVLAGLLLPSLAAAKRKARTARCVANLHQLGVALQIYVQEQGFFPLATAGDGLGRWQVALAQGMPTNILHCPERLEAAEQYVRLFRFPNRIFSPHYGYNYLGAMRSNPPPRNLGLGGDYAFSETGGAFTPLAESGVVVPSDMIAIGDSDASIYIPPSAGIAPDYYPLLHFVFPHEISYLGRPGVGFWHNNGAVMVFADGHTDHRRQEAWTAATAGARSSWNNDHLPHEENW